jgi:GTP-binding protein
VRDALRTADLLLLVVDARSGLLPADEEVAQLLRQADKAVLLVANKVEDARTRAQAAEFNALGFGELLCISAYHDRGIDELVQRLQKSFPTRTEAQQEDKPLLHLAIVGRPNVGKSLLLNRLLGQERVVVHEEPGTTRDAIDTTVLYEGKPAVLIDTAGIRRRGRVEVGVERFSVVRAFEAIGRADVVALVLDATELATAQDAHIAGYILKQHKGIMAVVNKWDLASSLGLAGDQAVERVRTQLKFLPYVPIMLVSALTGKGVEAVLPAARTIFEERLKQLSALELRSFAKEAFAVNPPSLGGKRLVLRSVSQVGVNPPTFVFHVNNPQLVHFSYRRYLERALRQRFSFGGTPLRLFFRSTPKAKAKAKVT